MEHILGKLLRYNELKYIPVRQALEQRGFSRFDSGKTIDLNLTFNDFPLPGQNLVAIGYDRDLDLHPFEWISHYPEKKDDESFSIYTLPLDQINKSLQSSPTRTLQLGSRTYSVPYFSSNTRFIKMNLDTEEETLFISASRKVTLPNELLIRMYSPEDDLSNLLRNNFQSAYGLQPFFPGIKLQPPDELTMPLSLFKIGDEYVFTANSLASMIVNQRHFLDQYKNHPHQSKNPKIVHARRFVNRFQYTPITEQL